MFPVNSFCVVPSASAQVFESTLHLTLSNRLFELSPSPHVFGTLRRLIGSCAPALTTAGPNDAAATAALYCLRMGLQALLVVVRKAAAAGMTPHLCGFHAGEEQGATDLTAASFMHLCVVVVVVEMNTWCCCRTTVLTVVVVRCRPELRTISLMAAGMHHL